MAELSKDAVFGVREMRREHLKRTSFWVPEVTPSAPTARVAKARTRVVNLFLAVRACAPGASMRSCVRVFVCISLTQPHDALHVPSFCAQNSLFPSSFREHLKTTRLVVDRRSTVCPPV